MVLFRKRRSDEWHQQIDFTASTLRPSDKGFPWQLVQKHTNYYLKKKRNLNQQDTNVRLGILIESHEARDIAIAACAHAMSPASVRALLNVELNVAPGTFYGLEMYLQSIIAANYCNPKSVSDLEAQWALKLIPFAIHGASAAGKYLEGVCTLIRDGRVPNMNVLPDFAILASKAFKSFASQLEGLKLRCLWTTAYSSTAWFSTIVRHSPATTPPGFLLPEHFLDSQFPIWRIWASWKPNLPRLKLLEGLDSIKRGVLPDMLALEGPDFIAAKHATLRDGMIAQYGEVRPWAKFRSLIIEVKTCKRDELKDLLRRAACAMEVACKGSKSAFKLFVQLCISRPINEEALRILEAVSKIPDTPNYSINEAVMHIYLAKNEIGGQHISLLSKFIPALDMPGGEALQKVMVTPYLVRGIEKCIQECQDAVRAHMETGLAWTHLALEFHRFGLIVKASQSCLSLLDSSVRDQLDVFPSVEVMKQVVAIYAAATEPSLEHKTRNALKDAIESFCIEHLMQRGTIAGASERIVDSILQIWKKISPERRVLAITAAKAAGMDIEARCGCLNLVPDLPDEFVKDFLTIVDEYKREADPSCVKLAKLLANTESKDTIKCWREILYKMLEDQSTTLLNYTLDNLKVGEWLQWTLDLRTVFPDIVFHSPLFSPPVLQSSLHFWCEQLSEFIPVLLDLEAFLGDAHPAMQCILKGGDGLWVEYLVRMLEDLKTARSQPQYCLIQKIAGRLSREGRNASEVVDCVRSLRGAGEDGMDAYQRILDSNQDKTTPMEVTEVVIAGWLQDDDLTNDDKTAIKNLATLLNLEAYEYGIPKDKLQAATDFFENQEAKILEEVARLEGIQKTLKVKDPVGTAVLLQQLGVPDISPLDEELESLPVGVIDAIEKYGENEVEMSFPLTDLTDLQRTAMGTGAAKTLLVRLVMNYDGEFPPAFCVHLGNELDLQDLSKEHYSWPVYKESKEPASPYCLDRNSRMTWQMSRIIHRYFLHNEPQLAEIHQFIKNRLENMAHCCIVCGITHNACHAQMRRSIPCQGLSCSRIWNKVSFDIQIPEIRSDPMVVDFLLTGVYAAASSNRAELLPDCPIKRTQDVTAILNSLPSLANLSVSTDLSSALRNAHKDAGTLLTWACTSYRGFIASTSGITRIPSMPTGTHQFILADANPALESSFASKLPRHDPQTRVLFHGTSLDRLPSILAQGLRVCSGTSLQRTGAAHGNGIYMAEGPATSLGYSPAAMSWRGSSFSNMRVLLGCEIVGNGNSVSPGIHVIKDEKTVMVRYIFLLTNNACAPNANHVVPAMLSAMSSLRSGAV
ncbi:hypothetical protein K469DRAFT_321956 [Zopfia rhizophila CBS 207.26]|uniref:PARP catalytic domain-containing protein n=1 Tax=Zopfia rhizophila CBS 207.26 TaxID=1314779 RepID=A0A6A6DN74_9PEZI|nr:hypothetical protein K469DRAFT_321956 [Zopfia rhizophila CBS 207.26]